MKRFLASFRFDPILHLNSDRIPFSTPNYEVFWRGYIANTVELQGMAKDSGWKMEQPAEADLFLFAYQQWGPDIPRHVLGEYSVVICDKPRRRLLLTHDELGLTPLFYAELKDELLVASHLEDAVQVYGVRSLDEEYIADYLGEGRHLGKRTPYSHIHRLLPGQSVVWKDGLLAEYKTWTLIGIPPIQYRDSREYEDELRRLTAEAVSFSVQSRGKTWCELSGGLDSSTVLAFAVRSGARNVEAFSLIYPISKTADERKWISFVLEKYPVPWHTLDYDAVRPFSEIPSGFIGQPSLLHIDAAPQSHYHEILRTNEVDLVLTGQGGDATFLGDSPDPYYLADLLRRFHLRQYWTALQPWKNASRQKRPLMYWLTHFGSRPWLRHRKGQFVEYEAMPVPWISPRFAEQHDLIRAGQASNVPPQASIGNSWAMEGILRIANSISIYFQAPNMACDFRHPLLYRPLLAFMLSVPWEFKLHPQCDRLLQRRAFEGILPEPTVHRGNKLGPNQIYYAGLAAGAEWCERLTKNPRIVQRGYVELQPWRDAIEQARQGRTIGIRFLWATASLEMWLQQLEEGFGAQAQSVAANPAHGHTSPL